MWSHQMKIQNLPNTGLYPTSQKKLKNTEKDPPPKTNINVTDFKQSIKTKQKIPANKMNKLHKRICAKSKVE